MDAFPLPEIQRVPLEEVVLQVKKNRQNVLFNSTLTKCIKKASYDTHLLMFVVVFHKLYCLPDLTLVQVLLLNLGTPESFLSQCLQPPSVEQVRQATAVLLEVRAVLPIPSIPLTALGYHLARMPVDVRIGKMLIYASLLQVGNYCLLFVAGDDLV